MNGRKPVSNYLKMLGFGFCGMKVCFVWRFLFFIIVVINMLLS